jgi:hypothetical protein
MEIKQIQSWKDFVDEIARLNGVREQYRTGPLASAVSKFFTGANQIQTGS